MGSVLLLGLSLLLGGCIEAIQPPAGAPAGTVALKPTQEGREAGLVGLASGFNIKDYQVVVVRQFKIAEPELNDEEDKRLAAEIPSFFQAELVRRLRGSGLFAKVVNASETESAPGADKALVLEGGLTRLASGSRAFGRFLVRFSRGEAQRKNEEQGPPGRR